MIRNRAIVALALGALLVVALPAAIAVSSSSSSSSSTSSTSQNVNIPRENVLSALALGASGPAALGAISSGSSSATLESTRSHGVSLDLDDVLGAIALGNSGVRGSSGLLGWSGGLGTMSCSGWDAWMTPSWSTFGSPTWWSTSWSPSWSCSLGGNVGSVSRLTPVSVGDQTLYMLPSGMAASFLAAYNVTSVPGPVLVGNNTTVDVALADMSGNNTTTLAPGVTEVMLAHGGNVVLVVVTDQTLARLR